MNRRTILRSGAVGIGAMLVNLLPRRAIAMALEATKNFENREKAAARARIDSAFSNVELKDKVDMVYANSLLDSVNFDTYVQFVVSHVAIAKAMEIKYGIPACIAMAQTLNESNAGLSDLAVKYNNYFGLTCKQNHDHAEFGCKFKNDKGTKQYFKSFVGENENASWESYADRLKNRFRKSKSGEKHMVYGKCFEQTSLRGRCKALGEVYAQSTTYATSLFTLIILFNLQEFLGVTMPLTDTVARQNASEQTIEQPSDDPNEAQDELIQGEGEENEAETVTYALHIEGSTLFSAVQNAYAEDITTYNIRAKLKGDKILTVKKVCDYIIKNFPASAGYGKDDTGRLLPLDFTIAGIPLGSF